MILGAAFLGLTRPLRDVPAEAGSGALGSLTALFRRWVAEPAFRRRVDGIRGSAVCPGGRPRGEGRDLRRVSCWGLWDRLEDHASWRQHETVCRALRWVDGSASVVRH